MKYRHTPSPREITESNDAATLYVLVGLLDGNLDRLDSSVARVAVMRAMQHLNAAVRKLNP